MNKSFENQYMIELPKLELGENRDSFTINDTFFDEFEYSLVKKGELEVDALIHKTTTHLDATFHFKGYIVLECDRCCEEYNHHLDFETRVIFSEDPDLEFDTDEVIPISSSDPLLFLAGDFYDFIMLEVPLRKVPEPEIHTCPPEVIELLEGNEEEGEESEEFTIDPRWEALKKLKGNED